MPRERTDAGTFAETVSLDAVLGVFDEVRGPAITSTDVANQLECTTEAARQKLTRLHDQGKVEKRKSGRTTLWWRADGAESDHERAMTPSRETPDQSPPKTPDTTSDGTSDESALADDLREYLEERDQPPKTAHGRGVVLDVFQLLRADGPMKTGDLQEEIYPDYTEHWGSARTMWNAIDRYLEEIPGIEKAGYGEWGYTGDDAVREALVEEF